MARISRADVSRADVFRPDEIAIVHVMNRTVRRCFLMGNDPLTGKQGAIGATHGWFDGTEVFVVLR